MRLRWYSSRRQLRDNQRKAALGEYIGRTVTHEQDSNISSHDLAYETLCPSLKRYSFEELKEKGNQKSRAKEAEDCVQDGKRVDGSLRARRSYAQRSAEGANGRQAMRAAHPGLSLLLSRFHSYNISPVRGQTYIIQAESLGLLT